MIVALTWTLVACNQTAVTDTLARWENETHVFKITLADFVNEYETKSDPFYFYDVNGNKTVRTEVNKNSVYSKDIAFPNEFYNWDEIKPLAVSGTYTINIIPSADKSECKVKTTQIMFVKYSLKSDTVDGVNLEKYSELREAEATDTEYTDAELTKEEGTTILKSTTVTEVTFENNPTQTPLSSYVNVDGFYIGKDNKKNTAAQQLTKYEIDTVYDYSNKRPLAKITTDGETTEYKFPKNSQGTFIDSNQILMYLRSLNKSSKSFQDTPSKSVFNPYTQTMLTASFGLSYEHKVVLTDTTRDDSALRTTLNVVSATVGNNAFMMQENLPDTLLAKGLDSKQIIGDLEPRFTTVRFRVGYFSYEIDYANGANTTQWDDIWTALSPAPVEEEPKGE